MGLQAPARDGPALTPPVALLVLGMHRSGTSALTGALRLCGVALGDALMPARHDNPAGFWEHQDVVDVHDGLLAALGMSWDDPRALPDGWLDGDAARDAGQALTDIVQRDFSATTLWAVKDPRLCRFVPLWRRVLHTLGIEPRLILMARPAGEIVASLHARDGLAEDLSGILWARHLLDAVHGSEGLRRCRVDYDRLLQSPVEALAGVAAALAVPLVLGEQQRQAVAEFLQPSLRHHGAAARAPRLVAPLDDAWADDGTLRLPEAAIAQFQRDLAPTQGAIDGLAAMLQQARSALTQTQARVGQLSGEADALGRWGSQLKAELEAAGARLRETMADADEKRAWAQGLQTDLVQAQQALRDVQADADDKRAWAQGLQDELVDVRRRLRDLQADADEKRAWAQDLDAQLQALRADYARMDADRLEKLEWAHALDAELGAERALSAGLREQLGDVQQREAAMERMQERMLEELARFRSDVSQMQARHDVQRLESQRQHDAQRVDLQQRIDAAQQALVAARDALQVTQALLRSERQAFQQWSAYARALEAASQDMLGSTSWRLTAPLRGMMAALRGGDASVRLPLPPPPITFPELPRASETPAPLHAPAADAPPAGNEAEALLAGLAFVPVAAPQVSIVIPTYGKLDYTARCLRAIAASGDAASFEVLVLEDASGDAAMAALRDVPGLRYHENAHNLGFLRSCNQVASLARGQYVCLLNNDTEPQPGWLDALLDVFAMHPDTGMAGAKLVYPDGRLQEAGGIVWRDASAWNYGRQQDPQAPQFCYVKEADYISGACIVLPMTLWRQLGGFDEAFAPAYCEDTDLAFRVRQAGHRVRLQPRAVVVHHEGISHGTDEAVGIKAHQPINQQKFAQRWRDTLDQAHFDNAEHAFLARDGSNLRKTLLIIDHYVPQPDRDAGSRTMWQFIRMFQARGMTVKFWPQNLWRDPVYTDWLQQGGVEVLYGDPLAGNFAQWLQQAEGGIDYVLLSRPHISVEFIDALRRHTDATLLYYGHDVHSLRLECEHRLNGDAALLQEAARYRAMEQRVWQSVDAIYYPAAGETTHVRQWLQANSGSARAATIPVYAFDSFPEAPWQGLDARRDVLFVAGFAHGPNVDGALWFVREVMPLLRARKPGLRVHLVGSNPDARVRELACDDVLVTGAVSDAALNDYYARSRVAIAPLRFGGGMKGKVIEAMRFGLPCVTTAIGQQGLEDTDGLFRVADAPDAFADAVLALIEDDAAWRAMSQAAQAHARAHYSEDALWRVVSVDVDPMPYASVQARRAHIQHARQTRA